MRILPARPDPAAQRHAGELREFVKSEIVRWGNVVKRAGVAATQ